MDVRIIGLETGVTVSLRIYNEAMMAVELLVIIVKHSSQFDPMYGSS